MPLINVYRGTCAFFFYGNHHGFRSQFQYLLARFPSTNHFNPPESHFFTLKYNNNKRYGTTMQYLPCLTSEEFYSTNEIIIVLWFLNFRKHLYTTECQAWGAIQFLLLTTLYYRYYYYSCSMDKKTKDQRGSITCSRLHNWEVGFELLTPEYEQLYTILCNLSSA